jgi:hypothetical protein
MASAPLSPPPPPPVTASLGCGALQPLPLATSMLLTVVVEESAPSLDKFDGDAAAPLDGAHCDAPAATARPATHANSVLTTLIAEDAAGGRTRDIAARTVPVARRAGSTRDGSTAQSRQQSLRLQLTVRVRPAAVGGK